MDIADLRILEAVAQHGSMNRAAVALNMVQSNVTARIRALEGELGQPLFDRSRQGVTLTEAGQRLLPYATQLAALLREAREAVRDDGTPRGLFALGTLETTAALRLPPILAAYAASYPEVDLVVTTGTSASLVAEVLARQLDGALVAGPVRHPDLVAETVFAEELVLVTPPRLGRVADLAAWGGLKLIVFRRGCSYRRMLEDLLARRGVQPARALEFGSLEAIIGCVAAGVGVTLLPRGVVTEALRQGRIAVHALPPEEARVETVFIRRRDARAGSAAVAFLQVARPASVRPAPVRLAAEG